MHYKQRKRKQAKPVTQEVLFRFFQNGTQYVCVITASIDIPKYRLKEAFDREFVGKKSLPVGNPFYKIGKDVTYEVQTLKEYEECQMNK